MTQTVPQGFALVSGLARELTKGELHLPSLPESVVRIRNALSKPDFTIDELARLITGEPALVGSILTMANSVAATARTSVNICRARDDRAEIIR